MNKLLLIILIIGWGDIVQSQDLMPTVFNNSLSASGGNYLKKVQALPTGELLVVGGGISKGYFAKISSTGKVLYETNVRISGIESYNDVLSLPHNKAIAVGGGTETVGAGRITLFDELGRAVFDKVVGENSGGYFTRVVKDKKGDFVAVGISSSATASTGWIVKVDKLGAKASILYKSEIPHTVFSDVFIDDDNNIIAMGGDDGSAQGMQTYVKVASNGTIIYEFPEREKQLAFNERQPNKGSTYTRGMLLRDASLLLIGGGAYGTQNPCRITRIHKDGQLIYDRSYGPADGKFSAMCVNPLDENIYLASEEFDQGRIMKLSALGIRDEKFTVTVPMPLVDLKVQKDGTVFAIGTSLDREQGRLIKVSSKGGKPLVDKLVDVKLKHLLVSADGEVYASAAKGYQIFKFDHTSGDILFKGIYGNQPDASFASMTFLPSGEIVAIGGSNDTKDGKGEGYHITKISHGASINDITINEPLSGSAVAEVTVSLTGFLREEDGMRKPVSIAYETLLNNTAKSHDLTPVEGVLSFVPSDYVIGAPIEKKIQVAIKSDRALEGLEYFTIRLKEAQGTYIAKQDAKVTIKDQPGVVRLVGGLDAVEKNSLTVDQKKLFDERYFRGKSSSLNYSIGLFKQDGTPIVNKTSSPIKVSYSFGKGSATPDQDFDASIGSPLEIKHNESTAILLVETYDDDFYESRESVPVYFSDLEAIEGCKIGFLGDAPKILRTQYIDDQPAYVQLMKVVDVHRPSEESTTATIFKAILVKAATYTSETNCSGGDITVGFSVGTIKNSAIRGEDFMIKRGERDKGKVVITGKCDNSEANIDITLYAGGGNQPSGDKHILMKLDQVTGPKDAGLIGRSPDKERQIAKAMILANN